MWGKPPAAGGLVAKVQVGSVAVAVEVAMAVAVVGVSVAAERPLLPGSAFCLFRVEEAEDSW